MDLIWKPITHFEGYEVSNTGLIRSTRFNKVRIMRPSRDKNTGVMNVVLRKNSTSNKFKIHRLVAEMFIPTDDPTRIVDHKDRNASNNHVNNLRWATNSENQANRTGRSISGHKGVHHSGERFYAKIIDHGKFTYLGSFSTKEEAAEAYRKAAIQIYGDFACFAHHFSSRESSSSSSPPLSVSRPTSSVCSQDAENVVTLSEDTVESKFEQKIDGDVVSWS